MSENKVIISCDSSCDLPPELIKKNNIHYLPITITIGDKIGLDGEITRQDIFDYEKSTGLLAKTSAHNVAEAEDFFKPLVADGSELVHFTLSKSMSVLHLNALNAAEEVGNVYVIDSKNLSSGIGLLVLAACDMAKSGKSAKEIADECTRLCDYVETSFVLSRLDYLHKGGRCSGVAVFGANVLGIKPCIQVIDGAMGVGKKYRGKFEDALMTYVKDRLSNIDDIEDTRFFVTDSGCDPKVKQSIVDYVKSKNYFKEIITCDAGCTISSHCGPNCLGVLFIRKSVVK